MARPRIRRRICFNPNTTYFKPQGSPMRQLDEVSLEKDETEAIRLIDVKGMEQEKASKQMQISQPTLSRLLISARKKIANAIINGRAIRINS